MNEKDNAPARTTIARHSSTGFLAFLGHAPYEELVELIADALTTVRKEARSAAFKEAHKAIDSMDVVITRFQKRSSDYNGWNSAIKQAHKAIEAAANSEEGSGDG